MIKRYDKVCIVCVVCLGRRAHNLLEQQYEEEVVREEEDIEFWGSGSPLYTTSISN